MAAKTVRAGVPVLASRAATTYRALELAREFRPTLVCRAATQSLDALNDPWHDTLEARTA